MKPRATIKPKAPPKPKGGARPGAGRKPAHVEANLKALMDEAWPHPRRVEVVKRLHEMAMQGSVRAAVALLDRALGKPPEQTSPDAQPDRAIEIRVVYDDAEPAE